MLELCFSHALRFTCGTVSREGFIPCNEASNAGHGTETPKIEFPNFPTDLIREITSYLPSPKDRLSLALVCRSIYDDVTGSNGEQSLLDLGLFPHVLWQYIDKDACEVYIVALLRHPLCPTGETLQTAFHNAILRSTPTVVRAFIEHTLVDVNAKDCHPCKLALAGAADNSRDSYGIILALLDSDEVDVAFAGILLRRLGLSDNPLARAMFLYVVKEYGDLVDLSERNNYLVHEAAVQGSMEVVRICLKRPEVRLTVEEGALVRGCILSSQLGVFYMLLREFNFKPNLVPLVILAWRHDEKAMADILLGQEGVDYDSLLLCALLEKMYGLARHLISHYDINVNADNGEAPRTALEIDDDFSLLQAMLIHPTSLRAGWTEWKREVVQQACRFGYTNIMRILVADPNFEPYGEDENGNWHGVALACDGLHEDILDLMWSRGLVSTQSHRVRAAVLRYNGRPLHWMTSFRNLRS